MHQHAIEQSVGITPELAEYINNSKTEAAVSVKNLIKIQVQGTTPAGMSLLKAAVRQCTKEMLNEDS